VVDHGRAAPSSRPSGFDDRSHTAATIQLSSGVHPTRIQEMLGHATVVLTLDVYSRVTPTMHDEAAATIQRVPAYA
jgi:integrase